MLAIPPLALTAVHVNPDLQTSDIDVCVFWVSTVNAVRTVGVVAFVFPHSLLKNIGLNMHTDTLEMGRF